MRLLPLSFALVLAVTACGGDTPTSSTTSIAVGPPEGLWLVSGSPSTLLRLAPDQLVAGESTTIPIATVTTPSAALDGPVGIAFDTDGSVWIASTADDVLIALAPASVTVSGTAVARTVIGSRSGSLSAPSGLAFDRDHRLWVANLGSGTVVRFDRAQLNESGAPVPALVLSGLEAPSGLAFDAAGALWVTDPLTSTISRFTAAQLALAGSPTPNVVLSAADHSIDRPGFPAFDDAGNLWVPMVGTGTVVAFTPAQLATTGSPAPYVVLAGYASQASPIALAFDGAGSLWVTKSGGQLDEFERALQGVSGVPAPSVRLALANHAPVMDAAFWPVPRGLPIN